jgi:hypothetical protein
MNNFMVKSRLLRCAYSLIWHVLSVYDVNATYDYTSVKKIYITNFYVTDLDDDCWFKICLYLVHIQCTVCQ